jgi:hypothetical protein
MNPWRFHFIVRTVRACADDASEPIHAVRAARGRDMISTDAVVGDTFGLDCSSAVAGTGPSALSECRNIDRITAPRNDPQAV